MARVLMCAESDFLRMVVRDIFFPKSIQHDSKTPTEEMAARVQGLEFSI